MDHIDTYLPVEAEVDYGSTEAAVLGRPHTRKSRHHDTELGEIRRTNLLILQSRIGGVGQTTLAALIVSRALVKGLRVHLIENGSSISTPSEQFAGSDRFSVMRLGLQHVPGVRAGWVILNAVEKAALEHEKIDLIVVDVPHQAHEAVDAMDDQVRRLAFDLHLNLTVGFLVSAAKSGFPKSVDQGLLRLKTARRAMIYPSLECSAQNLIEHHIGDIARAFEAGVRPFWYDTNFPSALVLQSKLQPLLPELRRGASVEPEVKQSLFDKWFKPGEAMVDWLIGLPSQH